MLTLACTLMLVASGALCQAPATLDRDIAHARTQAIKTDNSVPKGLFPHGGQCPTCPHWATVEAKVWVSGFLPGEQFLLASQARVTGNNEAEIGFLKRGLARLSADLKAQASVTTTHDVGFKIFLSYGYAYMLTGNTAHKATALKGARSLYKRYNPTIKAVKAWDPWLYKQEPIKSFRTPVIIDTMPNIELLMWAANNGGGTQMMKAAINHATTSIEHLIREDGCVWHTVDFDNTTAQPLLYTSLPQSYSPTSTWTRGQAWAVLGFTNVFRYTKQRRFADAAEQVAQCYLSRLRKCCSKDSVPPFDFDAPGFKPDSSAAAIMAAGLARLYKATGNAEYLTASQAMIAGLNTPKYSTRSKNVDFILLHGFGDYGKVNEDVALIYGDFYYIQALMELAGQMVL